MKKYYSIKSEGKWFAKVPGADADPDINDGRVWRHWKIPNKEGKTLGWFKQSLQGKITGAAVQPLGEDMYFTIYLDNDDAAQFKLYESNFLGLANILAGIDLNKNIELKAALNEKRAWKNPYNKTVIPTALYITQSGERIPQTWAYDSEAKWFTGLPKAEVSEKFGRSIRDTSLMEAAFDTEVDCFIQRVDEFIDKPSGSVEEATVTVSTGDDLAF